MTRNAVVRAWQLTLQGGPRRDRLIVAEVAVDMVSHLIS